MSNSNPVVLLQKIPFPHTTSSSASTSTSTSTSIYLLTNLLSATECDALIARGRDLQPSNVTPGTVRARQVFDDERLAERVWERVRGFLEGDAEVGRVVDGDGEGWCVRGLNSRWRLCLYEEGGKFSPHQDGRRLSSVTSQSFMTLNIYLRTVPLSAGGTTRFFPSSPYEDPQLAPTYCNQPVQGAAALFRDFVWHDGELVTGAGEKKYLLRTDVEYERERDFDFDELCAGLSDEERGTKALGIAEGLEDAGRPDDAVRWYKIAMRLGVGG